MLEKCEWQIKNRQSRDTGNIGQDKTQDEDKNTTQKTKKMSNKDPN